LYLHNTGIISKSNWTRKRNKKHPSQKGRNNTTPFPDAIILYVAQHCTEDAWFIFP
jgi:hypothetical protein